MKHGYRKTVISFSHTNYCVRSAGTEKFIRNISCELNKEGYSHLNIFSFYDDGVNRGKKQFGINLDDRFIGIYKYVDLHKAIESILSKNQLCVSTIHLQHLLHHDLDAISSIIKNYRVPVVVFAHDFFLFCKNPNLINSNGEYCGTQSPEKSKCSLCKYYDIVNPHLARTKSFFSSISQYLRAIITPSDFVADAFRATFKEYKHLIVVRPHLVLEGNRVYRAISTKVKIGFAGGQITAKGYEEWKKLISTLDNSVYEFYYLGTGKEVLPHVNNIYVSTSEEGEYAMIEALRDKEIVIAFLWPLCSETYSYVFYELAVNGVFIISNKNSGNVCKEIQTKNNGITFESFSECLQWFSDYENVIKVVNKFRVNQGFHPERYSVNADLTNIVIEENNYSAQEMKCSCKLLHSLAYRIKYRDYLK